MNYSGQIYPENTVGYFRLASTAGRQAVEPVAVGEFLIGSAAHCNLRFGDSDIPDVHTVIHVEPDHLLLRCSEQTPPMLINGVPTTERQLADGDMIELGTHRLLFRLADVEERITLNEESFSLNEYEPVSATAVEELVDRLDEQLQLVEELTHSPDKGMLELLQAVAESAQSNQSVDRTPSTHQSTELQQVTALIHKHHDASRIRLESLTEVLDNVVRQQKLIADTLEVMSERIQKLDSDKSQRPRRASA